MDKFLEIFGLNEIAQFFDTAKNFLLSCVDVVANCFGWLGPEFSAILIVTISIVIILRLLGR